LRCCQEGRRRFGDDPELLTQEAWALYLSGDVAGTEARLLQLLQEPKRPDGRVELGGDPGLRGHLTRHNLAVLYKSQNRVVEAEMYWRMALAEQPNFSDARLGLGELLLTQGRWPEMEAVLQWLEAQPHTRIEAAVLRSQKHLARRELTAARLLLEKTIAEAPDAVGPRIVLSRVLLAEGRDVEAARQALREVLRLDPNHREAQRQLAQLRQTAQEPQQGTDDPR
jgi:tetratricopeptide (TPR) repeat protein